MKRRIKIDAVLNAQRVIRTYFNRGLSRPGYSCDWAYYIPRKIRIKNRAAVKEYVIELFEKEHKKEDFLFAFQVFHISYISVAGVEAQIDRKEKELTPFLIPLTEGCKFFTLEELRKIMAEVESCPVHLDSDEIMLREITKRWSLFHPAGGQPHLLAKLINATKRFKDFSQAEWTELKMKFSLIITTEGNGYFLQVPINAEYC